MSTINIPPSIEAAVDVLVGVEALLRAKEWERAAIVAAFVSPDNGHGGREETGSSAHLLSARAFAQLGIAGLKSHHTVGEYAERWLAERPRPIPGGTVDLDGLPEWRKPDPGTRYEPGKDGAVQRIVDQPATVGRALAENPELVAKVIADPTTARVLGTALGKTDAGIDAALEGYRQRPQEQARRRANIEHQAAEDAEYAKVFRTRSVLPSMLMLSATADEMDTSAYVRDDEGAEAARQVASALSHLSRQYLAWAEGGSTKLDLDDELRQLLDGDLA